jgi:serine/threonine-protein kinase RsbT
VSPDVRRIPISHESDIVAARRGSREVAASLGLSSGELAVIATAISEIARNIVVYAKRGVISLRLVERNGRKGIEVVALDDGPGIADLGLAMQDGFSTNKGLGLGLPGARRLMDEFHIVSAPGKGTTITMIKWGR